MWLVICLIFPLVSYGEEFYVGDETLISIPETAKSVSLLTGNEELSQCQFDGNVFDLDGDGEASELIATTKNGCYAAAAADLYGCWKSRIHRIQLC